MFSVRRMDYHGPNCFMHWTVLVDIFTLSQAIRVKRLPYLFLATRSVECFSPSSRSVHQIGTVPLGHMIYVQYSTLIGAL
jgi:hypothetical protein